MATVGLRVYKLSLSHPGKKKKLPLEIGGEHDLFAWTSQWLQELRHSDDNVNLAEYFKTEKTQNLNRKALNVKFVKVEKDNGVIKGMADFGEYGRTGSIRDVATNEEKHPKTVREADMEPFYFRFNFLNGADCAVFMSQSISNKSLGPAMGLVLNKKLRGLDYTPKFGTYTDDATVREFLSHGELIMLKAVAQKKAQREPGNA